MRLLAVILIIVLSMLALALFNTRPPLVRAQRGDDLEPTPTPAAKQPTSVAPSATEFPDLVLTLTANRLIQPPQLSDPPNQIDKGAWYYWFVCIPCHGDKGQGLTDEWREVFGPEEMNCWQSGCHGARHPQDGFQLPRQVPAILGPGALQRFNNAAELHHVIATSMPWWDPDYISAEDEWNVTAYLLWKEGVLPPNVTLTDANAAAFKLRTVAPVKTAERPLTIALVGLLAVIAIGLVWRGRQS
jgi:hypothetical protein